MWLEAIDLLMVRMNDARVDFGAIVAISGAGQVRFAKHIALSDRDTDWFCSNMGRYTGQRVLNDYFHLWIQPRL